MQWWVPPQSALLSERLRLLAGLRLPPLPLLAPLKPSESGDSLARDGTRDAERLVASEPAGDSRVDWDITALTCN